MIIRIEDKNIVPIPISGLIIDVNAKGITTRLYDNAQIKFIIMFIFTIDK